MGDTAMSSGLCPREASTLALARACGYGLGMTDSELSDVVATLKIIEQRRAEAAQQSNRDLIPSSGVSAPLPGAGWLNIVRPWQSGRSIGKRKEHEMKRKHDQPEAEKVPWIREPGDIDLASGWHWIRPDRSTMVLSGPPYDLVTGIILICEKCPACVASGNRCGFPSEENADVLLAAPDLLAACEAAREHIRDDYLAADEMEPTKQEQVVLSLYKQLRAAIAKARGEDA